MLKNSGVFVLSFIKFPTNKKQVNADNLAMRKQDSRRILICKKSFREIVYQNKVSMSVEQNRSLSLKQAKKHRCCTLDS